MDIKLRPFKDIDFEYKQIHEWCSNKAVYEWFEQRVLSLDEIKRKYKNKINKQDLYIIQYNNKDIGLVQIYKYDKESYEYDLYIGVEEYLSKGIGTNIVNLVNDKIFNEYKAKSIILRPFKRNKRAVNCYLKAGFKIIDEYDGTDTLGNPETYLVMKKTN